MHELSIALSIVEIAQEESERRGGAEVATVHIKLGALSGIAADALVSSYEIAVHDTPLSHSRLLIEAVPVTAYCSHCRAAQTLPSIQNLSCPRCGALTAQILSGKEIELVALEILE